LTTANRYPANVFWSDEDEGFIAVASDLPGCSAFGETQHEALTELQSAIAAWIEAARAAGNPIPEPSQPAVDNIYSGKILVRMPKSLHAQLVHGAKTEAVSLNQHLVFLLTWATTHRTLTTDRAVTLGPEPTYRGSVSAQLGAQHMKLLALQIGSPKMVALSSVNFGNVNASTLPSDPAADMAGFIHREFVRSYTMAEVDTYGFDLKEVTTALIKQQGLHEGLWMVAFDFNLGAGMAGATKEEVRPMAFVQINKISLVRQSEIASGHNLVINAAEVNPAPKTQKAK
jgi:antitoxin HicB